MIQVKDLSGGYGNRLVLDKLNFEVNKGEFFGIIGPNGCGKSTLIRLLTGVQQAFGGEILLNNRPIQAYSRKEIARIMGVLPQEQHLPFAYTVREVLTMGRYAHQPAWSFKERKEDREIVDEVIQLLHLHEVANKPFPKLSVGQKQRVALARVLVQDPTVVLLDEPTNHLDLYYQLEILNLIKRWMEEKNVTVVCVFHDLNLTSLFCDRIVVLSCRGEMAALGETDKILTSGLIEQVFRTPTIQYSHPLVNKPQFTIIPTHIS